MPAPRDYAGDYKLVVYNRLLSFHTVIYFSSTVGQVFFGRDPRSVETGKSIIERAAAMEGLDVLGWREVPKDNSMLGATSLESEPHIEQIFLTPRQTDMPSNEVRFVRQ